MENRDQSVILPLPSAGEFDTMIEMKEHINNCGYAKGYAVSTLTSNRDRNVTFKCDFGGEYRNNRPNELAPRQRISSSRLIGCTFRIYGRKYPDGKWRFEFKNPCHNHSATAPIVHPAHRRLNQETAKETINLCNAGIKPKNILLLMQNQSSNPQNIFPKTIYNHLQKVKNENLFGYSPLQKLFQDLDNSDEIILLKGGYHFL